MTDAAKQVIEQFGLQPHPEGGWYRETWRGDAADGQRGAGTAVLYLLEAGHAPRWNRGDATEIWLWHGGGSLRLSVAPTNSGPVERFELGMKLSEGQTPQAVVPAGCWQAAEVIDGTYCLLSCVVAPAFQFETYELAPPGWSPCEGPID